MASKSKPAAVMTGVGEIDYRLITEGAEDAIWILDNELTFSYINPYGASMLGGSPEMIVGQSLSELFKNDALDRPILHFETAVKSGRPVLAEEMVQIGDRELWLSTRLIPIHGADGKVDAVIGYSRDVTERHQMEDKLKKREEELKIQLKHSNTVSELASTLIATDDTKTLLKKMVEVIGRTLDVDRTIIYRVDFEENVVDGMAEWLNPKTPGVESTMRRYSMDMFLGGALKIWKTRAPLVSNYNEVNPALVKDGSSEILHDQMKIKSLLWYPFFFQEHSFYAVVFNQVQKRRDWTEEEIFLAGKIAEQMTVAIQKVALLKQRAAMDKELKASLKSLKRTLEDTVSALAVTAEKKDPYTAGHQQRVYKLAYAIANELGLSPEKAEGVRIAAMVHDIGKIYIPAEILSKPSLLTDLEFGMVQTHSQFGFDILKTIDFPWPIAKAVLQHHERLDGSGYPLKLKDDQICIEARILAVADVVESMISYRPYRPMLGLPKALEEIRKNKGKLYDSDAADACLTLFNKKGFKLEPIPS